MHRTYVGPTSARYQQTPADIPPSSRYRPDVGMFAGTLISTPSPVDIVQYTVQNALSIADNVVHLSSIIAHNFRTAPQRIGS